MKTYREILGNQEFLKKHKDAVDESLTFDQEPVVKIAEPYREKFSDIDGRTAEEMELIKKYYLNPCGFFLMAGGNGTGKTFIAKVIYYKFATFTLPQYDYDEAFFINQPGLNHSWLHEEMNNLLYILKTTKLLVLDDIGTRTPTDAFMDFLYFIMDYRWTYRAKLGTVITTNLNSSMMREQLGDAFFSRVTSGICMRIDGEDRRSF